VTNDYLLLTVQFVGSWIAKCNYNKILCDLSNFTLSFRQHILYCTVIVTTCQLSHPSRSLIWMQNVTRVQFSHVNIIPLLYTILISILH